MSRKRWIWCGKRKELVPAEEFESPPDAGFFVRGDIAPYQSMVTGEIIEGRAAHKEHLKRHNVVEVGNDWKAPPKAPKADPRLKETIARIVYEKLRY